MELAILLVLLGGLTTGFFLGVVVALHKPAWFEGLNAPYDGRDL